MSSHEQRESLPEVKPSYSTLALATSKRGASTVFLKIVRRDVTAAPHRNGVAKAQGRIF